MKATFVRFDEVNGERLARFRLELPNMEARPFPRLEPYRLRAPSLNWMGGWHCLFAIRVAGDLKEVLPMSPRLPSEVDFEPVFSTRGNLVAALEACGITPYYSVPNWWVTWKWRRQLGSADVW